MTEDSARRGRPRGTRVYGFDEAVDAALHAIGQIDAASSVDGTITWSAMQASARELFESHRDSDRSVRSAALQELGDRFAEADARPSNPKRWFVSEILARARTRDLELRVGGGALERLRKLSAEARGGAEIWSDRVHDAAKDVFLIATLAHPVSRRDLLPLRVVRSGSPPLAARRRALSLRRSYDELWGELLVAARLELADPFLKPSQLVDAIGALEDGFLANAVGLGDAATQRVARRFADAVIALIEGATTKRDGPDASDS